MSYRLISQQMLLEHEVLARIADALRTAIGWSHHGGVSKKLESIQFLAESFQRHLERMLDLEEHGGYLELLAQSHPELQPELASFLIEHGQFREQMTSSLAALQQLDGASHAELDPLLAQLDALLNEIDAHNKREMQLLQKVVLTPDANP